MPKFRIYVNSALKWTGNAPDEFQAIEAAAKKAGQIWQVRFDTLPDGEAMTGRIFLHTDHDTPNMITDIRALEVVPLIHDARHWKPGARARGIDQTSTRAVDMYALGFEYVCYFPAGLNQKRFTIAANDVLKALELPYTGKEGTRERRRAEADLFHFAALEYVQEPTKSNKDRVLVHSFSMKASTKGERANAVRFWAFDNFSDEFLIPARHQYSRLEVGFLAYVYKHFTGSREKAGGIIKFMTAAHAKLMKEERRRAAAGEPVTGKIEVKVRFDENHWPNFRTKEENSEAKRIMKEAFAQANMIATYEERAFSMTLAGFFTMEGAPQQVESAPAPGPAPIPQGGRKVKKG